MGTARDIAFATIWITVLGIILVNAKGFTKVVNGVSSAWFNGLRSLYPPT